MCSRIDYCALEHTSRLKRWYCSLITAASVINMKRRNVDLFVAGQSEKDGMKIIDMRFFYLFISTAVSQIMSTKMNSYFSLPLNETTISLSPISYMLVACMKLCH